jgi:hypothetical protein
VRYDSFVVFGKRNLSPAKAAALLVIGAALGWTLSRPKEPKAPRPTAPVSSATAVSSSAPPPPEPQGPPTYVFPPHFHGSPLPNGQYQTEVRFTKTPGPWPADQESKFDVWFDGDVQKEFMSRGFESPVNFDVKDPEPKHVSIRITTPPIEIASYVSFTFKSAKPIQVLKTDVSPKSEDPAKADR